MIAHTLSLGSQLYRIEPEWRRIAATARFSYTANVEPLGAMFDIDQKKIAVLGDGHMATETLKIVASFPGLCLTSVVFHDKQDLWTSRLESEAVKQRCEATVSRKFSDPEVASRLKSAAPDLILSVNNSDIIRDELLAVPPDGIINFHNGPLPEYRGVNIPSWAIINGQVDHAITWHLVDDGVDSGPVVLSVPVSIDKTETAISLIVKCIMKGLESLPELLELYLRDDLSPTPQEGPGHYYSLRDSPDDGRIDLSWPCSRISALVRGLTFHPYHNTFVCPKILIGTRWFGVGQAEKVSPDRAPEHRCGAVDVDAKANALLVHAADGVVRLSFLANEDGEEISVDEIRSLLSPTHSTLTKPLGQSCHLG
jgi:methionyl-tRNA formyltransferase